MALAPSAATSHESLMLEKTDFPPLLLMYLLSSQSSKPDGLAITADTSRTLQALFFVLTDRTRATMEIPSQKTTSLLTVILNVTSSALPCSFYILSRGNSGWISSWGRRPHTCRCKEEEHIHIFAMYYLNQTCIVAWRQSQGMLFEVDNR